MSDPRQLREGAAAALAALTGSRAFDPALPDDPSRQPERDRYRAAVDAAVRSLGSSAPRPEVVTLCGSTRFQQAFLSEQRRLTLQGHIVISVGLFGHVEGLDMASQTKTDLDELHKRKIDLSDRIHVIDVGGYVGSSTRSEIEYATSHGIAVTYLSTPEETP